MDLIISAMEYRTGSTLLQRICNARKETLIWGEHGGILINFVDTYNLLCHFSSYSAPERADYFGGGEDPNNWIANMTPGLEYAEEAVIASIHTIFEKLYAPHRDNHDITGFKEVRYGKPELELFRKCYPKADIFLLIRHPVDIWKSGSFEISVEKYVEKWNRNARHYFEISQSDPLCHLISYENIVNRDPAALKLVREVARVTMEQIEYVLAYRTFSTRQDNIPGEIEQFIRVGCKDAMSLLGYQ